MNNPIEECDDDAERFGGPITDAMLHTALRVCSRNPGRKPHPRDDYDLERLTRIVNSWLTPISE